MEEIEQSPLVWLRSAWKEDPLEVLLPAAVGALMAQGLTAALVLRSHHHILLSLALMALGISIYRTGEFFWRLSQERARGETPLITSRQLQLLFLPLIAAIVLWGMIAPNLGLGIIFFLMSLPHLVLLALTAKRFTRLINAPALQQVSMIQEVLMRARLVFTYAHRIIALYRYSRVQRSRAASRLASLDS